MLARPRGRIDRPVNNAVDLDGRLPEDVSVRTDLHPSAEHRASLAGAAGLGIVHLLVDAVCVTSVLRASNQDAMIASAMVFVLAYDILAFAGQVPLGWLVDRFNLRRGTALLGILLTAAGFLVGHRAGYAVVLLAGLGNALFHLGAGAMVLAGAHDKAAPAGVFVAPGALGLGLGLLLGRRFVTVPIWPSLIALAAAVAIVLLVSTPVDTAEPSAAKSQLRPSAILGIATLLCLSVAVRSLVGTVGCDACDKTLFLGIALPCAGFAGKFVGGFLADRFGWIVLSMVALLASAPLLAFSTGDLWLALPGLVLFQMTMPVTLTAMFRLMPARPALGFGLLCLALIAGALPAYLPGVWRPHGLAILGLVIGSAAILLVALRPLVSDKPASSQWPTSTPG
jgi:MFS transporter, FSR family, fosmidomycin resistance protein